MYFSSVNKNLGLNKLNIICKTYCITLRICNSARCHFQKDNFFVFAGAQSESLQSSEGPEKASATIYISGTALHRPDTTNTARKKNHHKS